MRLDEGGVGLAQGGEDGLQLLMLLTQVLYMCRGEGRRGVTRFSAQGGEDGLQLPMLLPQVLYMCVGGGGGGGRKGGDEVQCTGR